MKLTAKTHANTRKILLFCGLLYSLLYAATDIIAGMLWEGYSFINQAISELSAVGAPTAGFISPLLTIYIVVALAFGFGVWMSAGRNRPLRVTGGLLIMMGFVGLAWTPFPMHLDEPVTSFANTMHTIFAGIQVSLILLAMISGVFAFRNWFRFYSIGTLLALLVAGVVSFWLAVTVGGTTAPPFFGLIERINVYGYLLWMAVLSIVLLRKKNEV